MRKSVRRATVVLALTPVVSVPMATAFAGGLAHPSTTRTAATTTTTVTTPAPPGSASAVGAEVNGVLTVGKTGAGAGPGGANASADALDVLGQRVSGGDQKAPGSSAGNVVGTGDTPVGDAEVAPWSASVTDNGGGHQSAAEAALAHANLAKIAEIWLLHSRSDASWSPASSSGDSQSDGAEVSALALLDVKVLHSEAHSTGKGGSDLLVVNGNEIGSSDQANGMCQLDASPLLDLICLTASGGAGKDGVTSAAATVASFAAGSGALTGTVSGSASRGGVAGTPAAPAGKPAARSGGRTSAAQAPARPAPAAAAPSVGDSLPFTGADAGRLATWAVALTALGGAMTAFARRRRLPFAA